MLAFVATSTARDAWGLARGDPLAAEAYASGVLSLSHADGLDDREAREMLARGVLDRLGRANDADVVAIPAPITSMNSPTITLARARTSAPDADRAGNARSALAS